MKKRVIWFVIGLFLFLIPGCVMAQETTNGMYISMEIKEDGSVYVKELARLEGDYNGRLRTIYFKNLSTKTFTGSVEDFEGSSIYNASGMTDIKVYDIKNSMGMSFDAMNHLGQTFQKVSSATKGDYGVYTVKSYNNGYDFQIFNPSSKGTNFYMEYRLEDAVVIHNDVAEFAWDILGDSYEENIDNLHVRVTLPMADPSMRVWAHGPLNGEIKRIDDQTVELVYDFLGAYNPIDIRLMFDKALVPSATKSSGVLGKTNILQVEEKRANQANEERKAIRLQHTITKGTTIVWFILLAGAIAYVYLKWDKEKKVTFGMQYYREFPGTYGPEVLEYLLKKNVDEVAFSASILEIVRKKVIKVEEDNTSKKKDYVFYRIEKAWSELTEPEKTIMDLLFNEIGNGEKVSLSEIKSYGKSATKAENFIRSYNNWIATAKDRGKEEAFYESFGAKRVIPVLVSLLGFIVFLVNLSLETNFFLGYLALPAMIGSLIYFIAFRKKTEKGQLHYLQWMAFKRFLEDFGRMDEKELPEVVLWEKYLVYATVLGCADTLEKQMRLKMAHMEEIHGTNYYNWTDIYLLHMIMHMNLASTITSTVHSAVQSSNASIAASQNASGGGFGGGVSSGGGGFGGGGGGGRF